MVFKTYVRKSGALGIRSDFVVSCAVVDIESKCVLNTVTLEDGVRDNEQ